MRIVYLHQYFITPQMAGGSRSYEMARRLVAAGVWLRRKFGVRVDRVD